MSSADDLNNFLSNEYFTEFTNLTFNSADKKESGKLDVRDLELIIDSACKILEIKTEIISKVDIAKMFKEFDKENSSYIKFDEYKVILKNIFRAMLEI